MVPGTTAVTFWFSSVFSTLFFAVVAAGVIPVETPIIGDKLSQVSLLFQIFNFFFQIIAVLDLVLNVSIIGTVEVGISLLSLPGHL